MVITKQRSLDFLLFIELLQGIRLTGGSTPNQGYLEVETDGGWGKICATYWTKKESRIACNMLGMDGNASPWSPPVTKEMPIILFLKSCHGNETSLAGCKDVHVGKQSCHSFIVRGVSCGSPKGKYRSLVRTVHVITSVHE